VTDATRGKVLQVGIKGDGTGGVGRVVLGPTDGSGKLNIRDVVSMTFWVKINKALTFNGTWLSVCGKGPGAYRIFMHGESAANGSDIFAMFQYGMMGEYASHWPNAFPADANGWLHIGCSYDGAYTRMYLNGKLTQELSCEPDPCYPGSPSYELWKEKVNPWKRDLWADTASPNAFCLGLLANPGATTNFKGWLDDFAIYHGVLDAQDFNDIYTGTKTLQQIAAKPPFGKFVWDESLVAAYGFEGDTQDVSPGPAADAVLKNGASIVSDSNQGNVVSGSDPNWYVDCGKAVKFDNVGLDADANHGFTVTAWIKPDVTTVDGWAMIASKGGAGFRMFYHSVDPTTGGRTLGGMINAGDTPGSKSMGNGGNMQPGQWYHVAIVYNPNYPAGYNPADSNTWSDSQYGYSATDSNSWPGRLRGYVNGLAAFGDPYYPLNYRPSNALRGPLWDTSADPLTIRLGSSSAGAFAGKIDDVRFYNKALTQLEVRGIMLQQCNPAIIGSDFTGDCSVNYQDTQILSSEWLNRYNLRNYARMAQRWLNQDMLWQYP
jgi:hypothetical protein